MATLAQGSSVPVSLPSGSTLTTFGAGSAVIGPGNQYGQPRSLYNRSSIGPFPEDVIVYLTATTAIEYYSLATGASLINALPSFTWAGRPSASVVGAEVRIRISDIGPAPGIRFVSDGTRWIPDGVQVLGRQNTGVSCPADTTEDTLYSLVIPADLVSTNSTLRIFTRWTITGSTNLRELDIRLGGSLVYQFSTATASVVAIQNLTHVSNRGVTNSQIGGIPLGPGLGNGTLPNYTASIDMTTAQTLVIAGKKAVAGETITLESASVELLP